MGTLPCVLSCLPSTCCYRTHHGWPCLASAQMASLLVVPMVGASLSWLLWASYLNLTVPLGSTTPLAGCIASWRNPVSQFWYRSTLNSSGFFGVFFLSMLDCLPQIYNKDANCLPKIYQVGAKKPLACVPAACYGCLVICYSVPNCIESASRKKYRRLFASLIFTSNSSIRLTCLIISKRISAL